MQTAKSSKQIKQIKKSFFYLASLRKQIRKKKKKEEAGRPITRGII
jgi:hypothetical protein